MAYSQIVVVNKNAGNSSKIISQLKARGADYRVSITKEDSERIISSLPKKLEIDLIVSGGDGTVNSFVNLIMRHELFPHIRLGIIPSGSANDFVRYMEKDANIERKIKMLETGFTRERFVDLIRVNSSYFVTGGGFGLPVDVVHDAECLKRKALGKTLGGEIYSYIAARRVLFGYRGFDQDTMALCIMNQPFIGRKFNLSKYSVNNDGLFEMCKIPRSSRLQDLKTLYHLSKGKEIGVSESLEEITIHCDKNVEFMADGEILDRANTFYFRSTPQAIKIIY